ncbi:MAG: LysM peptidoglycan-binding domain-containing protein [Wujia sp.]
MIEVIYDKNKDNEESAATEDKQEGSVANISTKLPKNIRQIGTPAANKRIYIEDYVVTYLNYIARPGSTSARGAILLGECQRSEIGDIIFISGAVDAENLEFDMDESEFTQEAWSEIYEQVKEYFPDLSVVGWFLSRMGFSTAINDKIEKMHVENFPGKDKLLYVTDSLESEDAFYMYERGQLVKQKGYYIYYSKNEAMQNYIVKRKGGMPEEKDTEIHRKDEEIIKSYREKNAGPVRKPVPKQNFSLAYVAGSFVVLAMLVMSVTVISNYDKMNEMETSIRRLELTAEENKNNDVAAVMATTEDKETLASASDSDVATQTSVGIPSTEDMDKNTETSTTELTTTEQITTEQTLPTSTGGNPTYYTIEYGDSLSSIALKYYGSEIYAQDIADANNIDINDKIYEGQEIILPTIIAR